MPGLVPGIHVLVAKKKKDVDGRDKPGHDNGRLSQPHLPAGEILHDLLGAAADGVDLDLAVDALDLDAAHEAGAAENLHRLGGAERHGLRGLVLQHADFRHRAFALIEFNALDWNRCSIAGTGAPASGYEARHNVQLETALTHTFDMHGGRARGDGTNIAGKWVRIHHNTFRATTQAVLIDGVPTEGAEIHHNWFNHEGQDATSVAGKARVFDNAYGAKKPKLHDRSR